MKIGISCRTGQILGRLMNFFSLPYSVPGKRYEHHHSNTIAWDDYCRRHRTDSDIRFDKRSHSCSFIEDQHMHFDDMVYGQEHFHVNGCAPIAIYNSLLPLSTSFKPVDVKYPASSCSLPDIIFQLETTGVVFGGSFGTSPMAVMKCIKKLDEGRYTPVGSFLSDMNSEDILRMGREHSSFIILICNDRHDISEGFHYLSAVRNGSIIHIHNGASLRCRSFESLPELLDAIRERSLPVFLIGISCSENI